MIEFDRRRFLSAMLAASAGPAIVRASSLMAIKALPPEMSALRPFDPAQLEGFDGCHTLYIYGPTSYTEGVYDGVSIRITRSETIWPGTHA